MCGTRRSDEKSQQKQQQCNIYKFQMFTDFSNDMLLAAALSLSCYTQKKIKKEKERERKGEEEWRTHTHKVLINLFRIFVLYIIWRFHVYPCRRQFECFERSKEKLEGGKRKSQYSVQPIE